MITLALFFILNSQGITRPRLISVSGLGGNLAGDLSYLTNKSNQVLLVSDRSMSPDRYLVAASPSRKYVAILVEKQRTAAPCAVVVYSLGASATSISSYPVGAEAPAALF